MKFCPSPRAGSTVARYASFAMQRLEVPQSSSAAQEVPSLAPLESAAALAAPLAQLAHDARAAPGSRGSAATTALHAALTSLPPLEANGAALLQLLDDGAFHELRADDGSSTRMLAVQTLLRLGYPWALQVHPDELAWFRRTQAAEKQRKRLIVLGVLGSLAVAAAWYFGT